VLQILIEIIFYWLALGLVIVGCMWMGLQIAIICEKLIDFFVNKK
jgi:hypothetical protein